MRDAADRLRELADRMRVLALHGLHYAQDKPYDRERYERLLEMAAELFAETDVRPAEEIRRTVFAEITHVTPLCGAEAAVFDDGNDGRLLLIQRSDNRRWALPG